MGQAAVREEKTTGRVNKLGGFFVDKVDGAAMRDFIKKNGVDVDVEGASDEQIALSLTVHFQNVTPDANDLCQCDHCHGVAPEALDACPFCAFQGTIIEAGPGTASPELDEPAPKKTKDKAAAPAKAKEEEPTMVVNGQTLVKVNGKGGKGKGKGAGEAMMAKPVIGEKELDAAVFEVIELKTKTFSSYFDLCEKVRDINQRQLWKLRLNDKGKQRYTGFDAFVQVELHMTANYAYGLIDVAKGFTADEMSKIGMTKAVLLMKAAPEDRERLKEKAPKVSRRELAEEVAESRKKTGHDKGNQQAKAGKKSAEARAKKKAAAKPVPADRVTIAVTEGRKTVKLYAKPPSMRNLDITQCKRAKTLDAQPFGIVELTNEITMHILIVKTDNGIEAKLDMRRSNAEE